MATVKTPFRYPGGKSCYAGLLGEIIRLNNYQGCIYCEPFAGGAGAGLSLFFDNKVSRLILNDADPAIYACWWAIVNKTKPFLAKLKQVPVTIQEWHNQRRIYRESHRSDLFTLGFATFFLNRCNRSGILDAGPIGGECQTGSYKIGARFNRKALVGKIEALGDAKNKIEIYNLDAEELICKLMHERSSERLFMYLDPPYYRQGRRLYMNSFSPDDHARYATLLQE